MSTEFGWKQLAGITGSDYVTFDMEPLRQRGWEGTLPRAFVTPSTREQLCEVMRLVFAERWRVAPVGNCTKLRMAGIPQGIDLVLSLRLLNRVTDYEPADLTISVEAGIAVEELAATLRSHCQQLPLDVPFSDGATVGGMIATNGSGPRRLAYGSVRDILIGVHFVTADGTLVKSGGKVVKNVAGYDMGKLLIGSFGTLGIITDVAFKVFPVPPMTTTFVLGFPAVNRALEARQRILHSPFSPQALDLVDAAAGVLMREDILSASSFSLVMAAAGSEAVVERIRRELPPLIRRDGPENICNLTGDPEMRLWKAIQETTSTVLTQSPGAAVIKASVLLEQIGSVMELARQAASRNGLACATLARAGTGIVYCYFLPPSESDHASRIERIAKACEFLLSGTAQLGGCAVVEWCPSEIKQQTSLWKTPGDDFPMMQRLKGQLDPAGILNPGRLYGKI